MMGRPLPIEGASPSAGNDVGAVAYAECYCGQVEAFDPDVGLPAGWITECGRARAWCPDCARDRADELAELKAAAPRPLLAVPSSSDRDPPLFVDLADEPEQLTLIPADAKVAGHLGCRIQSSVVAKGAAVLRIHAGARPIAGAAADRPVLFLARRADLAAIITELQAIDAAIAAADAALTEGETK